MKAIRVICLILGICSLIFAFPWGALVGAVLILAAFIGGRSDAYRDF
jgi:hypothetical protein